MLTMTIPFEVRKLYGVSASIFLLAATIPLLQSMVPICSNIAAFGPHSELSTTSFEKYVWKIHAIQESPSKTTMVSLTKGPPYFTSK